MNFYEYSPGVLVEVLRGIKAGNKTASNIAKFCNIAVPTARKALKALEKDGYIKMKSEGKKQSFSLKNKRLAFLGIRLKNDGAYLCLYSPDGNELCPKYRAESLVEAILSTAEKMMQDCRVFGVGIAVPSTAAKHEGLLIPTEKVGLVSVKALADELKTAFSLPVFTGTYALCGGIYYMNKTPMAQKGLTVFVSAGENIDCAIFDGGKLLSSAAGLGGLLGHMSLAKGGERCYCGNRGCLEGYASLNRLYDGGDMTLFGVKQERAFDDVKMEFESGETETVRQLENIMAELCASLANLINLLNPSHMAIGGDLVKIGDLMSAPIHSVIKQRVLTQSFNSLEITPICEVDEVLSGAAIGAFEKYIG